MRARFPIISAMFLAAAMLVGCESLDTRIDFDRAHNFSGYKSFAWMDDDPVQSLRGDGAQVSALNRQRIVSAIESEFEAKGITRAARERADFIVSYTVGARDHIEVESWPVEYRGWWRGGWMVGVNEQHVRVHTEGRLAIDIFDGASKKPVWSGVATKQVSKAVLKNAATEIPAAVRTVLAGFPPR